MIRCVLLLQEFDLEIRDKLGSKNVVADYLSHLEYLKGEIVFEKEIDDALPEEHLYHFQGKQPQDSEHPWFVDYANYLVGHIIPTQFSYQQRKKFL